MDKIMAIARKHDLMVVEDAAQAIDGYYLGADGSRRPLGGIGHLAAFSFHETKNIQCGEGGMLALNDDRFLRRAEIIWEKGTNRAEFFRREVDHYSWVDIGSSFLPSELSAAFLFAQLENFDKIHKKRKAIWNAYFRALKKPLEEKDVDIPVIPGYSTNNGHLFYLVCRNLAERTVLIQKLKAAGVQAVFHYQALHRAPFFKGKHDGRKLPYADRFSDCLLRLPLFYEISRQQVRFIISEIEKFYLER
jgi:dTDP-4-amino-4,6-dideoxygalactose transaminase